MTTAPWPLAPHARPLDPPTPLTSTDEDARSDAQRERDAESAAHVRWADAEQMAQALRLRSGATQWRALLPEASAYEHALLSGEFRVLARPFETKAKRRVRPLGVSALWAALLASPEADGSEVALELHVCPLSRSNDIKWLATGLAVDAETSTSALWGSTLLTVAAPRATIYKISVGTGGVAVAADDVSSLVSHARADACALAEHFAAVVQQRTLAVWRHGAASGVGAVHAGHQTYEHSCALLAVRLDACESVHSSLLLCSDERGTIVGFQLEGDSARPVLAHAPFCLHAASGTPLSSSLSASASQFGDSVVAFAFAGARFALATRTHLYVRDAQRSPKGCKRPLALTLRALGLSHVVALALWGEALLVHDDEQRVLVVDMRTGHVARSCVGEKARSGIERSHAAYQSVVCAGDQCGALLSNGALLFLDL